MKKQTGRDVDSRKQAAFDRAVANKMGLAGWMRQPDSRGTGGTAAQAAAARENDARAALKGRDLPGARKLVADAIGQRMQALSPRGRQLLQQELAAGRAAAPSGQGKAPDVHRQLRGHQRAVGYLRGVQQAMGDVASACFHEARKIDGTWPKRRR
ncbi:hypothetical protein [Ferrovibrio sp.]|uniref:hypothetical protein n=1 Tax=Ferrovibrio sp. TaxID=1917215 RepID=UPI003518BB6F